MGLEVFAIKYPRLRMVTFTADRLAGSVTGASVQLLSTDQAAATDLPFFA